MSLGRVFGICGVVCGLAVGAAAQGSSSSSTGQVQQEGSSSSAPGAHREGPVRKANAAGAALTLDTSEPLFDVAAGMNACGYDDDLANSSPVRLEIRREIDQAVTASSDAGKAKDALCQYMTEHELNDRARQTAQYVSLGLYLGPAPLLTPTADETEMPPDAEAVVNILPLLRAFAEAVDLHAIWVQHRPEYDAMVERAHDPVTKMILDVNLYLRVPVNGYDGRTLSVLLEPMLAPTAANARIYGTNFDVVTSPNAQGKIRMDAVRHLYLDYEIEPLVYGSAASMVRLTPLLKPVALAPIEYVYKTDVVALVTECLIRAIEARTMDVGIAKPVKPVDAKNRQDEARFDEETASYNRQAEAVRRTQVEKDMRLGWVLTEYFYDQLIQMEHGQEGLREVMGPMVYGMDVGRVQHRAEGIQFLPVGSDGSPGDSVRRVAPAPTGLRLAQKKMFEGDWDGAMLLAQKALEDPNGDHAQAEYVQAVVNLHDGDPVSSTAGFQRVVKTSKNPETVAWAHVYLGRLFDTKEPADRVDAVAEYKAALAVAGAQGDARTAAQGGLKAAFTVPRVVHEEEEPVDVSGKAEKDAYKPEYVPPKPQ